MINCFEVVVSKEVKYQQCTLEKKQGAATLSRTIWGPASHTKVGRVVRVEEDDGNWTEGWTVAAVHGEPLPERYVRYLSHAHTRQRKASDI